MTERELSMRHVWRPKEFSSNERPVCGDCFTLRGHDESASPREIAVGRCAGMCAGCAYAYGQVWSVVSRRARGERGLGHERCAVIRDNTGVATLAGSCICNVITMVITVLPRVSVHMVGFPLILHHLLTP